MNHAVKRIRLCIFDYLINIFPTVHSSLETHRLIFGHGAGYKNKTELSITTNVKLTK